MVEYNESAAIKANRKLLRKAFLKEITERMSSGFRIKKLSPELIKSIENDGYIVRNCGNFFFVLWANASEGEALEMERMLCHAIFENTMKNIKSDAEEGLSDYIIYHILPQDMVEILQKKGYRVFLLNSEDLSVAEPQPNIEMIQYDYEAAHDYVMCVSWENAENGEAVEFWKITSQKGENKPASALKLISN